MRLGVIGDVHGIVDEFNELIDIVRPMVDELWSLGDLVDRGPDSAGCIKTARKRLTGTIMGNHEHSTISRWDKFNSSRQFSPRNQDYLKTVQQLSKEDVDWMRSLSFLHVNDATKTILVHGGLWPKLELWQQPHNVIRAQMIHPYKPGASRWWGPETITRFGKTEEQFKEDGWVRWYELWDGEYNVVFGHSVFTQPLLRKNTGCGYTIGIDTGGVFGGSLTAAIIETGKEPFFVSVRCKKAYCRDLRGKFDE